MINISKKTHNGRELTHNGTNVTRNAREVNGYKIIIQYVVTTNSTNAF